MAIVGAALLACVAVAAWLLRATKLDWGWLEPGSWVATLVGTLFALLALRRPSKAPLSVRPEHHPVLIKMRSFDPKLAGVHPSIEVSGQGAIRTMPAYIPREVDVKLQELLLARERKTFALLLGGSSAGKTRAAYECVRACLPAHDVLLPSDTQDILWLLGQKLKRPVVVWLDELQRYLVEGKGPNLEIGHLLALWSLNKPVIVVGTMWPDRYQSFMSFSPGDSLVDKSDSARKVLNVAQALHVGDGFSPIEMSAAKNLAEKDARIKVALEDQNYGITQVLAGAPDLVNRWTHAGSLNKSIITAAVDIRRTGVSGLITDSLLNTAAQIYMSDEDMARASADWYESAIAYAVTPLKGATSALIPVARSAGAVDGYLLADYLTQYGERVRESIAIPDRLWGVAGDHVHDAKDLEGLGDAAQLRGLYKFAEGAFRRSFARGNAAAANYLGMMLFDQGRESEALEVLRAAAATGEPRSLETFLDYIQYLAEPEALLETRKVADAGTKLPHSDARTRLAGMLEKAGDLGSAEEQFQQSLLERRQGAHSSYAYFLERLGRFEEASVQFLLAARTGQTIYYEVSAKRLAEQGRMREAEALYREASARGDAVSPKEWWCRLLIAHGRYDDARGLGLPAGEVELAIGHSLKWAGNIADALSLYLDSSRLGNAWATLAAIDLLEGQGRFEEALPLRVQAARRFPLDHGLYGLVEHLVKRGSLDTAFEFVEACAELGHFVCSDGLGAALIRQGRVKEAMVMYRRSALVGTDGSEVNSFWRILSENGYNDLAERVRRDGFELSADLNIWETDQPGSLA
ncbi:tetratricopeptide repeat protein [Micromonospora taraxaci]|uniref:tetratricopeptide repeat protein n=1 Tax=Micromonospora taraxaci TaxID=1316803 RepID=UPI0034117487